MVASPPRQPHARPREALIDALLTEHVCRTLPRLQRLWAYYRNPTIDDIHGPAPAQALGLPPRLRCVDPATGQRLGHHRERVIENDIAWRVHALVDFMFGRAPSLRCTSAPPERAAALEALLHAVFERAGGVGFLQDLGLLGSVYGHVDVLVGVDESRLRATDDPAEAAAAIALELVEAPRAVPLLANDDYRRLDAYLIHCTQPTDELEEDSLLARVRQRVLGGDARGLRRGTTVRTRLYTARHYAEYVGVNRGLAERRQLVETGINRLGRVPVVHIQNLPQPFAYEGLSEVEPLIPLQDELNTRLSDRANRVTFQSFKMYLGKGIEAFEERPVGPGQMWSTDNLAAHIEEFGGDADSPGERDHIQEVREALDKCSGVTPVAAGILRDKVGNLTSENALRITLMGLLAKTQKKRVTYGAGLARVCELVLHAADVYGLLPNTPDERRVRFDWPDPLPAGETQALVNAQRKLALGVPREQVLSELGYADCVESVGPES